MTITVMTLRGTSEVAGSSNNMLCNVTSELDQSKYIIGGDLPYPASIGPDNSGVNPLGASENQSVAQGVDCIAYAVRKCPDVVGLIGYSLGAEVVSRFLELKGQGQYADCKLAWAAMVANPNRAPGESIDSPTVGYGINGAHSRYPVDVPVFNAANPQDGITSCPGNSPLRTLADQMSGFTFAGTSWSQDLMDRMLRNRWQPADPNWWMHPIETWNRYDNAAALLRGYLIDGQHMRHYIADGYCKRLAAHLNDF